MQFHVCFEKFSETVSLKIASIPIFFFFWDHSHAYIRCSRHVPYVSYVLSCIFYSFFSLGLIWILSTCPSLTSALFCSVWPAVKYLYFILNWRYFNFLVLEFWFFLWIPLLCEIFYLFIYFIIQNNHGWSLCLMTPISRYLWVFILCFSFSVIFFCYLLCLVVFY